jgi:hypothetical protein
MVKINDEKFLFVNLKLLRNRGIILFRLFEAKISLF